MSKEIEAKIHECIDTETGLMDVYQLIRYMMPDRDPEDAFNEFLKAKGLTREQLRQQGLLR